MIIKREYVPFSDVEAAKEAIVLYPSLRKELLDAVYSVNLEKVMKIKIKDVLARQISGMGLPIRCSRDVIYYSELPVLCSALNLFSKNIITTANDTEGCYNDGDYVPASGVYITNLIIDYGSLDEANKLVADTLVESGNAEYQEKSFASEGKGLIINVPCSREDTVYTVNKKMLELVSQFHKQDMIYIRKAQADELTYKGRSLYFDAIPNKTAEALYATSNVDWSADFRCSGEYTICIYGWESDCNNDSRACRGRNNDLYIQFLC